MKSVAIPSIGEKTLVDGEQRIAGPDLLLARSDSLAHRFQN
jgi:hypothetical protein